jgi:hypothetical protein
MSIAFVNHAVGDNAEGATGATSGNTGAFAVTATNAIVVFIRYNVPSTITAVTDTIGNTYTEITAAEGVNGSNNGFKVWWCAGSIGTNASNVVTVGNGTTDSLNFWSSSTMQFSGAPSWALGVADFANGNSATPTSNSFSTIAANEAVCFACTGSNPTSPTVGGSAATVATSPGFGETETAWLIETATQSGITTAMAQTSGTWALSTVSIRADITNASPSTFSVSDPLGTRIPGIH